jgi:hypothetical protein
MKKIEILGIIAILAILSVSIVAARKLPTIGNTEKGMFKNLVQGYFHPEINGWGIGLNTEKDSYLIAKFHAVSTKTLPNSRVAEIIKEAREGNSTSWSDVRDKIKAALDTEGTTKTKGRMQINKETYVLTGIVRTNTTFTTDIRTKPDYSACVKQNITAEDCETQSTKVGDLSLTQKTAEFETNKQRVWAGTMDFNDTSYTLVAIINPRE